MRIDPAIFSSFQKPNGRRAVVEIYDILHDLILSGRIAPDTILSQVELSKHLGVSRTPIREVLRRLQETGLISAEPNFRSRVLGFDPVDIEALYMKRILMEALGVTLTAKQMNDEQRDELHDLIAALESDEAHNSFTTWLKLHRKLHCLIVSGAGETFVTDLEALERRSERYQSAYKTEQLAGWWRRGEEEHRCIYEAMIKGDGPQAASLAARHLARTALELLAALAPEYDTSRIRASLQFAVAATSA